MDVITATILAGFGGAVIGVALAESVHFWRDRLSKQERLRHVRVLLRREMQHNQDSLRQYRESLDLEESATPSTYEMGRRAAFAPLPRCGHLMWESQAPSLADALDDEEFARLYTFHTLLDAMTAKHAQLVDAQPPGAGPMGQIEMMANLQRTERFWLELEDSLQHILAVPVLPDKRKIHRNAVAWAKGWLRARRNATVPQAETPQPHVTEGKEFGVGS
jgi:hypothetical protein